MRFHEVHPYLEEGKILTREGAEYCVLLTTAAELPREVMKAMTGKAAPAKLESCMMVLTKEGSLRPFILNHEDMMADDWKAVDLRVGETVEDRMLHRGLIEVPESMQQDFLRYWTNHECGTIISMNHNESVMGGRIVQVIADSRHFAANDLGGAINRYTMLVDEVADKVEFRRIV